MDPRPFLDWLEATPVALFMQVSSWAFPTVEAAHVLAIVLVVGVIAIVDLRLIGVASGSRRVTEVARDCLAWTWVAFGLAIVTGLLMFAANANTYFDNTFFRLKMLTILLAGVNMMVFELFIMRSVSDWDHPEAQVPTAVRVAGFLSLGFWILVVTFGRWIGFTLFQIPF